LGKRHSGQNHADAVALLGTIKSGDEEAKNSANRLRKILATKNIAGYEERLMHRSDAEKVIKDAERFLGYVRSQLPEE
jgi:HEPN domain-containing protein